MQLEERHLGEEQLLGDSGQEYLEDQLLGEAWRFHPFGHDLAQNHFLDHLPLNKKKKRKVNIKNQILNQEIHTKVLRPSQSLINLHCKWLPSPPQCSFL